MSAAISSARPATLLGYDVEAFWRTGFFECVCCFYRWQPGAADDGFDEREDNPQRHCPRCQRIHWRWNKPVL